MARRMVGEGRGLNRRQAAAGLALLPIAACQPSPKAAKSPPPNLGQSNTSSALLELVTLNRYIRLDIRYATTNNFTGRILYAQPRAFLVTSAAQALLRAHLAARAEGFGLLLYDAYRPWSVTKKLWDATPRSKREFVANPKIGSRHNRGCAVDLTLYDLTTGNVVEMPSEYDEFSKRAYRSYNGGDASATQNRARLERYMTMQGFAGISNEWWHFDFRDWANYPILDIPFEAL